MKKIWNWNNFKGWLSDNPYLWQPWQYQDWVGIDVQTEPNWFKLTSDYNIYRETNTQTNVILDLQDYWGSWLYFFCAWWEIYKDTTTNPIYTDITGSAIVAATAMYVSWTLYIYYFTAIGTIHKIATDWTWHTALGFSLIWSDKYPIVNYWWDIYFGDKYTFKKLDTNEALTTIYTAERANKFVWMTFFQDSFRLYSALWGSSYASNGRQFIFSTTSSWSNPDYIVDWKRLPILWVCNVWATDYVVTGSWPNYSDLYQVSWTQRQLIKSNFEVMQLWRKFTWQIVSWKDEVFLLGYKDNLWTIYQEWKSVFRIWQYFPWLPTALTEILRTGWRIYSLFASYNMLYIWVDTWSVYRVYSISLDAPTSTYISDWYVTSLVFNGWDATSEKTLEEIDISYMCDSTNPYFPHRWTIEMYARKNPNDSWTQVWTNYVKNDIGNIKISKNEITAANMWDFYQIELKCLIRKYDATHSPLVTWIKVIYDDNINP